MTKPCRITRFSIVKPLLVASIAVLSVGCGSLQKRHAEPVYEPVDASLYTAPARPTNGSLYPVAYGNSLFEDTKARHVGDLVTIVLTEKTNATKKATTTTKKENTTDSGTPSIFGGTLRHNGVNLLSTDIESTQEFTGEGDSTQSNALNGTITVLISQVLPNGNLVVRGQKRMQLNQGDEFIHIAGIVRPMDIRADNTIPSTLVANAQITYSGEGAIADANRMGWLARFFNSAYWPF